MDTSELKELIEPDVLAECLGLDYQMRSGRCLVLCPFHNDKNLGSAFIKDGYFHCFSCEASMDVIELVRKVNNCSFMEAIRVLSDLAGVECNFQAAQDNGYLKFRLNKEEIEVLDIPTSPIGLAKVYASSPKIYKQIITEKAKSKKDHYEYILNNITDRSAPDAYVVYELYNGAVSPQIYRDIKNSALHKIRVCDAVLERFD